jgi:hypothetical protein
MPWKVPQLRVPSGILSAHRALQAVLEQHVLPEDIQRLNVARRRMLQQARGLAADDLEEGWAALASHFARVAGLAGEPVLSG